MRGKKRRSQVKRQDQKVSSGGSHALLSWPAAAMEPDAQRTSTVRLSPDPPKVHHPFEGPLPSLISTFPKFGFVLHRLILLSCERPLPCKLGDFLFQKPTSWISNVAQQSSARQIPHGREQIGLKIMIIILTGQRISFHIQCLRLERKGAESTFTSQAEKGPRHVHPIPKRRTLQIIGNSLQLAVACCSKAADPSSCRNFRVLATN